MQILNIVVLRPEIELCYVGIASKCFEILENKNDFSDSSSDTSDSGLPSLLPPPPPPGYGNVGGNVLLDADEDDDEDDEDVDVAEDDDADGEGTAAGTVASDDEDDDVQDDSEYDDDGDSEHFGAGGPRLSLREILFYEDKVSIFKARHGKL